MPARIMLAALEAAHAAVNRHIDTTERVLLSHAKIKELERKRVDRIIKELNDELYREKR